MTSTPALDARDFDPRSPAVTSGVPRPPVLKALTSVRFFAAFHVALNHVVRPFSRWGIFAGAIGAGYTGVAFFFFLSGFILTYAHAAEYERGKGSPLKFWVARFARIYPTYLLVMLVALLTNLGDVRRVPYHAVAFAADLVMMQSWSMRMVNFFHVGAWTLSCEAFFYFLFPFLLMRLRPKTRGIALALIAGFYLLAMIPPLAAMVRYPQSAYREVYDAPGSLFVFTVRRLPVLAAPEFLAGVSLGWFYLLFKPTRRASAVMAWLGLALLLVALFFAAHLPFVALHNGLLIPAYSLLLLGLTQDNALTRILSGRTLVLLGEASFALYLVHLLVESLLEPLGYGHGVGAVTAILGGSIALSVLMHLYVERPCRRAILRWWGRRHPGEMKTVRG